MLAQFKFVHIECVVCGKPLRTVSIKLFLPIFPQSYRPTFIPSENDCQIAFHHHEPSESAAVQSGFWFQAVQRISHNRSTMTTKTILPMKHYAAPSVNIVHQNFAGPDETNDLTESTKEELMGHVVENDMA